MNDGSACEHEMGKSCRRPLHAGRRPLRVLVRGRRRPLLLLVLRSPDVSVRSLNAPCLSFSSSENERTRSVHVLVQVTGCDQFHLMFPALYGLLLRRRVRCLVQFSPLQVTLIGAATLGAALDVVANALLFFALPDLMEAPDWLLASAGVAAICKWAVLVPTLLLLMPFSPMMARIGPMTIPFAQFSRYDRFKREREDASASSRKVQ